MGSKIRNEKNCLNCGADVPERFCPHCGQENIVPHETTGHLIRHFISDLTHYDSQFPATLRDLLFRPGFLTKEYLAGKRIRYLNPVRMYFFISFLFFIVLFSQKSSENKKIRDKAVVSNINPAKQWLADSLKKSIQHQNDLSPATRTRDSIIGEIASRLDTAVAPAQTGEYIGLGVSAKGFLFTLAENDYDNVEQYDSAQKALPKKDRNGFIGNLFIRKNISIKKRFGNNSQIAVSEEFQHNVPKLMFILLPLFALLLLLFFHARQNSYANHIIFSIHYHSFVFLALLTLNLLTQFIPSYAIDVFMLCAMLVVLEIYLIVALKNVYGQSYFMSSVKAVAISVFYFALLIISLLIWAVILFFTA